MTINTINNLEYMNYSTRKIQEGSKKFEKNLKEEVQQTIYNRQTTSIKKIGTKTELLNSWFYYSIKNKEEKIENPEENVKKDTLNNSEENTSDNSKTESNIVVKADGSRVLIMTMQVGGMQTSMNIEISKPTEVVNNGKEVENKNLLENSLNTDSIQNISESIIQ